MNYINIRTIQLVTVRSGKLLQQASMFRWNDGNHENRLSIVHLDLSQ